MSESLPTSPSPAPLSSELQAKLNSLRAIVTTHSLLTKGSYPYGHDAAIGASISFLEALHANVLAEVKADPQANQVPELQKEREASNAQGN